MACVCECGHLIEPPVQALPRPVRRCTGKRPQGANCKLSTGGGDVPARQLSGKLRRMKTSLRERDVGRLLEVEAASTAGTPFSNVQERPEADLLRVARAAAAAETLRTRLKGLRGAFDRAYLRWSEGVPWRADACPTGDDPVAFEQENHKIQGTQAYARYEQYKRAKTVREAARLGARRADIRQDFDMGYMERRRWERRRRTKPKRTKKRAKAPVKIGMPRLAAEELALIRARSAVDRSYLEWVAD